MGSGVRNSQSEALAAGWEALARGAWSEAQERFESAIAERESPEALIGLGVAGRYQFDAPLALGSHEAAYRLARERTDARAAGRAAVELVTDCLLFRGPAEAQGWLERAAHVLQDVPKGEEWGRLTYLQARFALAAHDPRTAYSLAHTGFLGAREGGAFDGEMACLALEGLALVADGARRRWHAPDSTRRRPRRCRARLRTPASLR